MAGERFVLLGLARAQAPWYTALARGATSAALPIDLVKSVSAEELRARLRSGRSFSALLIDASLPACDRDLVELAHAHGCAVVVVTDATAPSRPWLELGASAVLPVEFGRDDLLDTLRAVAQPIARADEARVAEPVGVPLPRRWRGRVVAVTGAPGTGRSTLAMALAAGLADDPRDRGLVVLADLSLYAQQGLLHDAGDVVPSLLELVDGYRNAVLGPDQVRSSCFSVAGSGYDLLLGLRQHRDWTALRAPAFRLALDGLRRAYRTVVADVDGDVEGESETGSIDVEDRNMLARITLGEADVVLVVGVAGLPGIHAHLRVLRDVLNLGVPAERVVPVVNRAPRSPRSRAEIGHALVHLLRTTHLRGTLGANPLFVSERRRLDDVVRDGGRLPTAVVQPVASAVRALLQRSRAPATDAGEALAEPVAIKPGSLPTWDAAADALGEVAR
jgi:hypothetical protein